MVKKRTRRKASEIERLRAKIFGVIQKENKINLTDLVGLYGSSLGVRDTASDKNLVKRQLDVLADSGRIHFGRDGRNLIARLVASPGAFNSPAAAPMEAAPMAAAPAPHAEAEPVAAPDISPTDLDVIKAYAAQVEEFSRTLHAQISTLVRMIDRASR